MSELVQKIQNAKIYFGVPTVDGNVNVAFLKSMCETQRILDKYGIQHGLGVIQRDCYVARARNEIANAFLKTDYTHLFFIDADMGWEPLKVVKMLGRDKDIVFGGYINKDDNDKKYVLQPLKDDNGNLITENGLIKCLSGPTGFMCIKREVLEKMNGRREYYDKDEKFSAFFHCSIRKINGSSKWMGEDIDFCLDWHSLGGELWCEPDISFQHVGIKIWECNFMGDLREINQKKSEIDKLREVAKEV